MRVTFLQPEAELTDELLGDVIGLVDQWTLPAGTIARWTRLERILAYDWAMREHLRASDNPVRRRDRPSFLGAPA